MGCPKLSTLRLTWGQPITDVSLAKAKYKTEVQFKDLGFVLIKVMKLMKMKNQLLKLWNQQFSKKLLILPNQKKQSH